MHADPKTWRLCQRTDIEHNRLLLQREKFQRQTSEIVLRAATDARLQAIANSRAGHTAKLNQVGQILFRCPSPLCQSLSVSLQLH
jgi:hypothetical protein